MLAFHHGDLAFTVRDNGPADGEVVVLLHGFPQDASSWQAVEPHLNAAGYRTLAPDQRGYTAGARPTNRSAYSSAELMADIVALLDAAEVEKAHIVGHDWGGNVAWMLAGSHPERTSSVTVISTPHPAAMKKAWLSSTQAFRSWYMLAFQIPWLPEFLLSKANLAAGLRKDGLSKEMAQHTADLLAEPNGMRGAINWYRGLPYSFTTPTHRTRVPAAYVWGTKDPFLGRTAAELTRQYIVGDYQFTEVDGGHWLPDTHAELVASKIIERAKPVG